MQRVTISIDEPLGEALDQMAKSRSYASRSEAIRDIARAEVERWRGEQGESSHCVANLSYIFDRRVRALPQRLAEMQHEHHDLIEASTVVRLDHFFSFESVILKGATGDVRAFADKIRAERGVRFGAVNLLSVAPSDEHRDPGTHVHSGHRHLSPIS